MSEAYDALDAYITALGAAERELSHLRAIGGAGMYRIRTSARITKAELARRAGVTSACVRDMERGRRDPSERVLVALLRLLAEQG